MEIIILIPVLLFSIILHEFAHGFVAYRLGDDTAYYSGRLSLNPLKHIDPVGTVAVPALCALLGWPMFGWAKPVPVNPMRLSSPRRDMGKVALAGPAVNLLLAVVCALLLKIVLMLQGGLAETFLKSAFAFFQYGILVNVMLAVFNLIPIPPLDGGRIAVALLPVRTAIAYEQLFARYGMWIVIGLILTGAVKYIILPPAYFILSLISKIL